MNPWFVNAEWQNYSSMFREAVSARESNTGSERSHHLTAALYFGIASLEAFLNRQMRTHSGKSEEELNESLRRERFMKKVRTWPMQLGRKLSLDQSVFDRISQFNDIRGDLTHPKTQGHDTYNKLEAIDPSVVVGSIAEYLVAYHEAEHTRYPYWIFGWNYLNPRPNAYEIIIVGDQQFSFSLAALGFQLPTWAHAQAEAWRNDYLGTIQGYRHIRKALDGLDRCEPKDPMFPFQPKLCRRWWTERHQRACGCVTDEARDAAHRMGAAENATADGRSK